MNKVTFTPIDRNPELILELVPPPTKASSSIASWFKDAPRFSDGSSSPVTSEGSHNLTVRHCMAFIDALSVGYTLNTWTDIYIKRENDEVLIGYEDIENVNKFGYGLVQYQKQFQSYVPTLAGHDPFLYVWSTYWRVKTPPGTSCLFVHPLNRTDLPFHTLSGITDTDRWSGSDVLNFALKEGFEGLIPKGTPFVQIIPFTREEWEHETINKLDIEHETLRGRVTSLRHIDGTLGYYRDHIWEKKVF
jgi:hypothetical protein